MTLRPVVDGIDPVEPLEDHIHVLGEPDPQPLGDPVVVLDMLFPETRQRSIVFPLPEGVVIVDLVF